jgi:hypothetical protein
MADGGLMDPLITELLRLGVAGVFIVYLIQLTREMFKRNDATQDRFLAYLERNAALDREADEHVAAAVIEHRAQAAAEHRQILDASERQTASLLDAIGKMVAREFGIRESTVPKE